MGGGGEVTTPHTEVMEVDQTITASAMATLLVQTATVFFLLRVASHTISSYSLEIGCVKL